MNVIETSSLNITENPETWEEFLYKKGLSVESRKFWWLEHSQRTTASNCMYAVLTDESWQSLNIADRAAPTDAEAFESCVRLLTILPELRPFLYKMKAVSDQWKMMVEQWKTLETLYKLEEIELLNQKLNVSWTNKQSKKE